MAKTSDLTIKNKPLTPSQLNIILKKLLDKTEELEDIKWQASKNQFEQGYDNLTPYYQKTILNGKTIINTATCNYENDNNNKYLSGNLSLAHALAMIMQEENDLKNCLIQIPLASLPKHIIARAKDNLEKTPYPYINNIVNYLLQPFCMGHFTYLYIDIDQEGKPTINHYDSKGSYNNLFKTPILQQIINNIFKQALEINYHYLNHQPILDNYNCARFVLSYMNYHYNLIAKNGENQIKQLENFTTEEFTEYFAELDSLLPIIQDEEIVDNNKIIQEDEEFQILEEHFNIEENNSFVEKLLCEQNSNARLV